MGVQQSVNITMTVWFHLNVVWILFIQRNVCIIVSNGWHTLSLLNDGYLILIHTKVIVFAQKGHGLTVGVAASHDAEGELLARLGIPRLEGEDGFNVESNVGRSRCKFGG